MFWKKLAGSAAIGALALASAQVAVAQETTSALRGAVTTIGGDPLAGATITITHTPTGTRSVQTANAAGVYDARGLRVGGPYTVEVAAGGYQTKKYEGLYLVVGESTRLNADLEEAAQEIVVTAAALVGANEVGSTTSLDRDQIEAIVSINRDIRDLARRDPLVSANLRGDGGISIAGSNPRTNRISIDGVQAQDDFGLNTGGLPTRRGPVSIDAVDQFTVAAVPFDVENGDFLGGAINVVLRQGANDWNGSAFVNYLNEGLVGTRIKGTTVKSFVTQDNYGATLRGPIVKDRLFFALSYETYESQDVSQVGPAGQGFSTNIVGPTSSGASVVPMTLGEIAAVTNVFSGTYGSQYPVGGIPLTRPITDEKYTGRFDWNITDNHRATFTYRKSESGVIQRTNINSGSAGLLSQWYLTGEDDQTYSLQVNSDWTDSLSTEVRLSRRDYTRLQEPTNGQNFADIRVCSTATNLDAAGQSNPFLSCRNGATSVAVVRFGPDQFRHANFLETQNTQGQFAAEYSLGAHLLKAGVQYSQQEIFNLFLPNSRGTYYFDSISQFSQGFANQLIYRNALSGNPRDAAAAFTYNTLSLFAQDTWDITDFLSVSYGLRYDSYTVDDKPALNPNFVSRYGFNNQTTYDDLSVVMPRLAATWRPMDNLKVSGGLGLFSGGLPDVFLSNSFSNTGILDNTLQFERSPTSANATSLAATTAQGGGFLTETTGAVNCVATPAVCLAALNVPVSSAFGSSIPASVQAALGGSTVPATSETNSIAPNFSMPSDWRANLAVDWEVLDGWKLGLNAVYVRTKDGLAFRDIRSQRLIVNGQQALTPDGRVRYDGLSTAQRTAIVGTTVSSTNPGSSRDIQAFNPDDTGSIWTAGVGVSKYFDNGLNIGLSYTLQNSEEFSASARFSSTASSLYSGQYASLDPNTAIKGRGQEEISDAIKAEFGWRHNFVGDLETRVSLFGDWRKGRPVTFTMNGGSGRNATFGVNRGAQLAYVPDLSGTVATTTVGTTTVVTVSSDARVAFDSVATVDNLRLLVGKFGIPTGGIVPRGSFENPDINVWDLQISQQIPALFEGNRASLTFDIGNVLNLLNSDWGVIEEYGEDVRLFDVACAGANGVSDNAGVLSCGRYRISGPNATLLNPASSAGPAGGVTRNTDRSRWQIQVGLKYEF
jgi:outer membrane receptor for ferrienterochelin and colicin